MKKSLILILTVMSLTKAYCSDVETTFAAESLRVFNNVAKDYSVDSLFFNPALLNKVTVPELFLTYNILYPNLTDGTEFVHNTVGIASKLPFGGIGIGFNQFGVKDWYVRNKFVLSYGCNLSRYINSNLAIGLKIEYNSQQYSLDEYIRNNPVFSQGNQNYYIASSIGVEYLTSKYNKFGIVVENINRPDVGMYTNDVLPLVFNFGYNYVFNNFSLLPGVKIEFKEKFDYTFLAAAEYKLLFFNNKLRFLPSLGMSYGSREYNKVVFGFAIHTSQVSFSYSVSITPQTKINTGNHQCISLSYKFTPIPPEEEKVAKSQYDKLVEEKIRLEQELEQVKKFIAQETKEIKPEVKPEQRQPSVAEQVPTTTEELLLKKIQQLEQRLKEAEVKKTEEKPKPITTTVPQPPPPSKKRYHTVVPGDTLPKLAEKYYGDASQWRKIYEANKDKIIRGQLVPNSVLEIP